MATMTNVTKLRSSEGISVPVVGASCEDFTTMTGYDPSRVKVRIQFISPELAETWLKLAEVGNRNKRPRRVETIAGDMLGKKYAFTGVPILFDSDGGIFDGRHRLAACVRSKVGFWALIVTGIDREQAMGAVDDVSSRKNGDRLTIKYGCENANAAASICLLIWQFTRTGKSSSWSQPSFYEIEKLYLKYRSDIEWVMSAIGAKIQPGISSGGAPVLAPFVFVRSINRGLVDAAAEAFESGENMMENDPMRKLRQKVSAFGSPRTKETEKIGNKNSSSQFSRFSMSMFTLGCLERVLTKQAPRTAPTADTTVLDRLSEMLKASPTAIKPSRVRSLPPEQEATL